MSSQVTRLESGGMIQVRTGVIQGIGPQGPVGATGPQGETGPQGVQGVPGPAGSVTEYSSQFTGTQSLAATTITSNLPTAWTNVSYGTVVRDELSAQSSTVNFVLGAGADYNCFVNIRFPKPAGSGTGFRAVRMYYNSVEIVSTIHNACSATDTVVQLNFGIRSTSGSQILNIQAAHNEVSALTLTSQLWINRTGPGTQGVQGIQGVQGVQGPTGPTGPQGPAGSLITNSTTIADIGGTNP